MEFGFNIHVGGPLATPDNIRAIARRGEELGFAILSVPDHIVFPRRLDSHYPYSESGRLAPAVGNAAGDWLEPLALLAHLAGVTAKVRLLTAVMVVPYRHPVLTAKLLSTIDVLSGGRMIVGCGAGWLAEEFAAVGAPPFAERGRVTDEYIAIFKELWTQDKPRFEGAYAAFSDIFFAPKPAQKPHPPIWIGGESGPAIRRAARLGDGWFPVGCNARHPLDTIERFSAGLDELRRAAEELRRDPETIDLAFWAAWYGGESPIPPEGGTRQLFTGSAEEVATDIKALEALGVGHVVLNFVRATLDETLASMEHFVGEVLPLTD